MNEYIGTYTVKREMHMRPLAEVANVAIEYKKNRSLGVRGIYIRNTGNERSFEAGELLSLMANRVGIWSPGRPAVTIDVIARGDAEESVLKAAADKVGAVFQREGIITSYAEMVDDFI
jgi:hypothetical protein